MLSIQLWHQSVILSGISKDYIKRQFMVELQLKNYNKIWKTGILLLSFNYATKDRTIDI